MTKVADIAERVKKLKCSHEKCAHWKRAHIKIRTLKNTRISILLESFPVFFGLRMPEVADIDRYIYAIQEDGLGSLLCI
jgi:hypothetical protein